MALDDKLKTEMARFAGLYSTVNGYEQRSYDEKMAAKGQFISFLGEEDRDDLLNELSNKDDQDKYEFMSGITLNQSRNIEEGYMENIEEIVKEIAESFNRDLQSVKDPNNVQELFESLAYAFVPLEENVDPTLDEAKAIKSGALSNKYGVRFRNVVVQDPTQYKEKFLSLKTRGKIANILKGRVDEDNNLIGYEPEVDVDTLKEYIKSDVQTGAILYSAQLTKKISAEKEQQRQAA